MRGGVQTPSALSGEQWLLNGILSRLTSTFHVLRVQAPFSAVGAELGSVQPSGLQHNFELIGGGPTLGGFFRCGHHLSLQSPGLPPFVEGDHMDAQLF